MGSEDLFMMGNLDDYGGTMLWDFICRRVKPMIKVGATKLKDMVEGKDPNAFVHDLSKYNTWFEDTREAIITEEGEGYNKYTRMIFKA